MNYVERALLPIRLPMRSQAIETALHVWELEGVGGWADRELLERVAAGLRERAYHC